VIQFDGISKRFPGVTALDQVSFTIERGECHALLGENGAGKSTLGKILAGLYRPDGGRVLIDGREAPLHSPRDAAQAGVGIVHQELVFCPNLSVAENLCLHDLPRRGWVVDRREMRQRARRMLAEIGLEVDVDQPLAALSIGQEQMVQIAAAVGRGARILVFDEPTSSLGRGETARLFDLIRRLQARGTTIIYVSHRLEEIFELCQTVTVLRDGRHVATRPIGAVDHDTLVRLMVGREIAAASATCLSGPGDEFPPRELLRVENFSSPGKFSGVEFKLRSGEIMGFAGLVGAGRTEIAEALFGLDRRVTGDVWLEGKRVRLDSPRTAQRLGVGLIPEDRKRHGLVLSMNVRENLTLPILERFRRLLGRADRQAERAVAERYCRQLRVRAPSVETGVLSLSGGNQQKVVLAKWMAAGGRVLLIDEPTRGVDVGAKQEIHELIRELSRSGVGVLLISSDLPELLALSDRVAVLRQGRMAVELSREAADPESVLRHMAGVGG